jgi:hypothetical protein
MATLSDIRLAAKRRADMESSFFVADDEWLSIINASAAELYDLLIAHFGDDYYSQAATATTTGNGEMLSLPANFYKLTGVDMLIQSTTDQWVTIRPFNMSERNRTRFPGFQSYYGLTNLRYRLNGSNLWLIPKPSAGITFRIWYVPRFVPMTGDASTLDGVSGWEEYVVVDAAIKALVKEESDPSALMAQKAALKERIEIMAANRDPGGPQTVSDVTTTNPWEPWGGFYGGSV